MSKVNPKKVPTQKPDSPRCPFCGRRITVRQIDDKVYHCDHCQKMFQG